MLFSALMTYVSSVTMAYYSKEEANTSALENAAEQVVKLGQRTNLKICYLLPTKFVCAVAQISKRIDSVLCRLRLVLGPEMQQKTSDYARRAGKIQGVTAAHRPSPARQVRAVVYMKVSWLPAVCQAKSACSWITSANFLQM